MDLILDATASFRSMWFSKNDSDVVFMDVRSNGQLHNDWSAIGAYEPRKRADFTFKLSVQADFCHLPFRSGLFSHVTFDPPHLFSLGRTSIYYKLYGALEVDCWRFVLRKAAGELWRVLKPGGTLNLKWNDRNIPFLEVLRLFPMMPRYGQKSSHGNKSHTFWFSFVKPLEGT